jgi:hypothetical protein
VSGTQAAQEPGEGDTAIRAQETGLGAQNGAQGRTALRRRERSKYRDRMIYCAWGRHYVLPMTHVPEKFRQGVMCLECQVYIATSLSDALGWMGLQSQLTDLQRQRLTEANAVKKTADKIQGKSDAGGFVYYIRINGRIKIGYAKDVRARTRHYPPGSELLAVEPGTPQNERERHQDFNRFLVEGREWFTESPAITEHIRNVRALHGDPAKLLYKYTTRGTR